MEATKVKGFSHREPGRGKVYHGIFNVALDAYVAGTGFILNAETFRLANLIQVLVQPVDCAGVMFDWDEGTGVLKAYTANGVEALSDSLNGKTIRVMYWGF